MIEDLIIKPTASIKEAMRALDISAEKILFIVDKGKKLLGSLTDGDVRRYILGGHALEGTIEEAYNREPFTVFEDFNHETVRKTILERKIEIIPVLSREKKIIKYIAWADVFDKEQSKLKTKTKISIPVVIMAGGKGTRLDPFTRILPKPLIPIGNKPIVELIIEKFQDYQIDEYYLTLNSMSGIVKAYFEERKLGTKITFIEEDKPLGTAGSLRLLGDRIKGPFFVTNCDIIINTDYGELFEFHAKNNYDISLVASLKHYNIPYGICKVSNDGHLQGIEEKPEYSFLVNTGLYILNHECLDLIPKDVTFHITDLIEEVRSKGGKVGAFPVSEASWLDVGQWSEYKKTLKAFDW